MVIANPVDPHVLTIVRRDDPFADMPALPGGYWDLGERAAEAASRELSEETGLPVHTGQLTYVGMYDNPDRDPRGHVVSHAFGILIPRQLPVVGADDAVSAEWLPVHEIRMGHRPMAFDHAAIVNDAYLKLAATAQKPGSVVNIATGSNHGIQAHTVHSNITSRKGQ
ncbi:NUDIX hydrolase [Saccharopolyspora shandongensis]|uniref:NUDIX hydrolase n=1 Tax=Saccharopolyspora shandongensis TaxID=418495 RepID=UPI0033DB4F09